MLNRILCQDYFKLKIFVCKKLFVCIYQVCKFQHWKHTLIKEMYLLREIIVDPVNDFLMSLDIALFDVFKNFLKRVEGKIFKIKRGRS